MRIPLDNQSKVPLYRQIENYIREAIQDGSLAAETRLPPTRKLSEQLGVSRITVQNAYLELESDGLIASREGSGTMVLPSIAELQPQQSRQPQWPLWQMAFQEEENQQPLVVQGKTDENNQISFTGVGDPREYPIRELRKAIQDVIRRDESSALSYNDFEGGYLPLRRTISHLLASQGIRTQAESVLITSGSQQALSLICQVLLKPGDVVLVESPTYNLALELFATMQLQIVEIPIDHFGMCVDQLESILQQYHPRLIYTIPNFQNPSGACMSNSRRRELVRLADQYNVAICEDDYVGDLRYDGRSKPALKALDPGGRVLYIGTFSKMLMPGLRVGYVIAEGPVFTQLQTQKRVSDLTTSPFIQRVLYEFVNVGRYQSYIRRSSRLYKQRRDATVRALRKYFGHELEFAIPQGGLFLWLQLPPGISSEELYSCALREGVVFAPGTRFFVEKEDGIQYIRINFAPLILDEIDLGIIGLRKAYLSVRQM
ncbi:MAG: PLP-dependent aminotransferase family protein [Anaerolineaceae bacterium]|nr:PLP-dependent aminotransferase family protein [Anaerolineaceae bacterium]